MASVVTSTGLAHYHEKMKTLLASKSNTNHTHNLSTMINTLGIGNDNPTDNDYYVSHMWGELTNHIL